MQRSGLEALHRLEHRVFNLTQAGFRMRLTPRYQLPRHCLARRLPARQHLLEVILVHGCSDPALSAGRSVTLPDYAKLRRAPHARGFVANDGSNVARRTSAGGRLLK